MKYPLILLFALVVASCSFNRYEEPVSTVSSATFVTPQIDYMRTINDGTVEKATMRFFLMSVNGQKVKEGLWRARDTFQMVPGPATIVLKVVPVTGFLTSTYQGVAMLKFDAVTGMTYHPVGQQLDHGEFEAWVADTNNNVVSAKTLVPISAAQTQMIPIMIPAQ